MFSRPALIISKWLQNIAIPQFGGDSSQNGIKCLTFKVKRAATNQMANIYRALLTSQSSTPWDESVK